MTESSCLSTVEADDAKQSLARRLKRQAVRLMLMAKSHKVSASRSRWSQRVTESSNALDLEPGVFTGSPRSIAESLKSSAERSKRRKAGSFRSAMSMLTFYINRAGKQLSVEQRERLESAKDELREVYGRPRQG